MSSTNTAADPGIRAAGIATAPAWIPEAPGDRISGTVLGFETYENTEYGSSPILVIETDEPYDDANTPGFVNFVRVYAIGMLHDKLAELKVSAGNRLTVVYGGTGHSKARDRDYRIYSAWIGNAPTLSTDSPFK